MPSKAENTMLIEGLNTALQNADTTIFIAALGEAGRQYGMGRLAKEAKVGRESLYKALTPGTHPRYDTVARILKAMGLQLRVLRLDDISSNVSHAKHLQANKERTK